MRTNVATVADYLAAQPPAARAKLRQVCAAIRRAAPKAVGSIAYGMPAFKVDGRPLLYVGGWKTHYSLYPSSDRLVAALGEAIAPYERSKGTITFPLEHPVPVALITKIATVRLTLLDGERPTAGRTGRRRTRATSRRA